MKAKVIIELVGGGPADGLSWTMTDSAPREVHVMEPVGKFPQSIWTKDASGDLFLYRWSGATEAPGTMPKGKYIYSPKEPA